MYIYINKKLSLFAKYKRIKMQLNEAPNILRIALNIADIENDKILVLRDPKDYTGFKSNSDYIHFYNTCITRFNHVNNDDPENEELEHIRQVTLTQNKEDDDIFIQLFESEQQQLEQLEPGQKWEITMYVFLPHEKPSEYLCFYCDCVKKTIIDNNLSSGLWGLNNNNNSNGQTVEADIRTMELIVKFDFYGANHGFKCKINDFYRFLFWNILRSPHHWKAGILNYGYASQPLINIAKVICLLSYWYPNIVKSKNQYIYNWYTGDTYVYGYSQSDYEKIILKQNHQLIKQTEAFLMGTHQRLGQNSPIQMLCFDIVEMICKFTNRPLDNVK